MTASDTKTALLDCAQDLIQRVGANAMSYNDLSKTVGIRKASIHYHFPKKEDLIIAILSRCREEYTEIYNEIIHSDHGAKHKLYMLCEIYEENLRNDKTCILGMLSVEYESLGEKIQAITQEAIINSTKFYEQIFLQAIEEKSLSSEVNTYDAAYGFLSCLLGAQIMARCNNDIAGFTRVAKLYIEALIK